MSFHEQKPADTSRGSQVPQGLQIITQCEQSYKHIQIQQSPAVLTPSQPAPPVSTFSVHSNPTCYIGSKP